MREKEREATLGRISPALVGVSNKKKDELGTGQTPWPGHISHISPGAAWCLVCMAVVTEYCYRAPDS